MLSMKSKLLTYSAFALAMAIAPMFSSAAIADTAKQLPIEDFFRQPEKADYQISPDGTMFSWLQPWEEGERRLNVMVAPVDGSKEPKRLTSVTTRDIAGYTWVSNDYMIYMSDTGGDENFHIWLVDVKNGTEPVDVTPYKGVRAMLFDVLKHDPDNILVMMNKENPEVFDVYKLNLKTKELTLEAKNPGNVTNWVTDHKGNVRIAVITDGVNEKMLYRDDNKSEFKPLLESTFKDTNAVAGFTYDNKKIYLISNVDRDKAALYELDPHSGKKDLIYENPDWDISNAIFSDVKEKMTGVSWYAEKRYYHFFDEDRAKMQEKLTSFKPGYEVSVVDASLDETKFIVGYYSDKLPGVYYFYDKNDPDNIRELANLYPWIDPDNMATVKPITYKSRDGLTIHGYLTLPKGMEDAKNLPLVVNPHGGPEARDTWGFNPEAQMLANRGVAVFQPNYRISTGYGKEFWMKGFKQWGQAQQDDITDGVKWLIEQGIADPKRIAIYGASYGGYATLMGLIKTPDLYACGVDYVGVSDITTLLASVPAYWKPMLDQMKETIGDPEKDAAMLKEYSPIFHADKIVAPLFIAQGANDPRVIKAQSDKMVKAMKDRGVEVEYMVKDNEGHGFHNEENRMDFYKAMIKFLSDHLKLTQ